ncbi:MAG: hypothetical protein U9Q67_00950 [Patescibacteria group bacterium]|nr:hypothetical protein [Patescibacteria group bacterium]
MEKIRRIIWSLFFGLGLVIIGLAVFAFQTQTFFDESSVLITNLENNRFSVYWRTSIPLTSDVQKYEGLQYEPNTGTCNHIPICVYNSIRII